MPHCGVACFLNHERRRGPDLGHSCEESKLGTGSHVMKCDDGHSLSWRCTRRKEEWLLRGGWRVVTVVGKHKKRQGRGHRKGTATGEWKLCR